MQLEVPYYSQLGIGARNACGEACAKMISEYVHGIVFSIQDMQQAMGREGLTDTLAQLRDGLKVLGVESEVRSPVGLADLATFIGEGKPPICLVNYARIPPYAKTSSYAGGHFVVVVGMDAKVHYHDPLNRADVTITKQEFDYAFQSQCLITKLGRLPVEDSMDEATFLKHWVPYVRDMRRRTNKLLKNFVKKIDDAGTVAMFDSMNRIIRPYSTETAFFDDGWKWEDVDLGRKWHL